MLPKKTQKVTEEGSGRKEKVEQKGRKRKIPVEADPCPKRIRKISTRTSAKSKNYTTDIFLILMCSDIFF